jgi:hypothetical protein
MLLLASASRSETLRACMLWYLQHWEAQDHMPPARYTSKAPPISNSACASRDGGGRSHQRPHVLVRMPDLAVRLPLYSAVFSTCLNLLLSPLHTLLVPLECGCRYFNCPTPSLEQYMRPLFGPPSEDE